MTCCRKPAYRVQHMTRIRPVGDRVGKMNKYSKFGGRCSTVEAARCCLRVTLRWACMSWVSGPAGGRESAAICQPHPYSSLAANQLFNQPVFLHTKAAATTSRPAACSARRRGGFVWHYLAMQRAVVEKTLADTRACHRRVLPMRFAMVAAARPHARVIMRERPNARMLRCQGVRDAGRRPPHRRQRERRNRRVLQGRRVFRIQQLLRPFRRPGLRGRDDQQGGRRDRTRPHLSRPGVLGRGAFRLSLARLRVRAQDRRVRRRPAAQAEEVRGREARRGYLRRRLKRNDMRRARPWIWPAMRFASSSATTTTPPPSISSTPRSRRASVTTRTSLSSTWTRTTTRANPTRTCSSTSRAR